MTTKCPLASTLASFVHPDAEHFLHLWFYQFFFFIQLQRNFVAHLANVVASGNGIAFFVKSCKDLLHNWQVFPLGNTVCKKSRSKCKLLLKRVFLLFKTFILFPILIPILIYECSDLIYEHSDSDRSWWTERFNPMSQTHIRKWRYITAKWQLGSIKNPYLEHRPGPSLGLRR